MRTLSASLFAFAVGSLVACGDDGAVTPDARPPVDQAPSVDEAPDPVELYDFSCHGNTLPAAAPAVVAMGGMAVGLDVDLALLEARFVPLGGGTVLTCGGGGGGGGGGGAGCGNPLNTVTANMFSGQFLTGDLFTNAANPGTAGTPLDVFFRITKDPFVFPTPQDPTNSGFRPLNVFPHAPLHKVSNAIPAIGINYRIFGVLASPPPPAEPIVQAVDLANVVLMVQDCSGRPIKGAEVKLETAANAMAGTAPRDMEETAGAAATGTWAIYNVPVANDLKATVTFEGETKNWDFPVRTVRTFQQQVTAEVTLGHTTLVIIRPGV